MHQSPILFYSMRNEKQEIVISIALQNFPQCYLSSVVMVAWEEKDTLEAGYQGPTDTGGDHKH